MEEKRQIKISLKTLILLLFIILIAVALIVVLILNYNKNNSKNDNSNTKDDINNISILKNSENYKEVSIGGKTYYQKLNTNTWNGDYHQEKFEIRDSLNNIMAIVSYSDYLGYIDLLNSTISDEIEPYYSNKNSNYIILSYANGYSLCKMQLIDCLEQNNKIIIYGDENVDGVMAGGSGYFIAIPTDMAVGTEIEYRECYTNTELDNLKKYNTPDNPANVRVDKPIIYLYPTDETEVSVKLLKDENIICSYPKYQNSWNVLAKPNGDLKDLTTNRQLYSLYYESKCEEDFKIEDDGFIVKGEDSAKFLEEKLKILGLTERESEEFIVYWLPKLESNKYNYIRFATLEEINKNMPLEINPNPDTIIRVLMTFKGLEKPIDNIKEQQLQTPSRTGFVAVEWGGTEIK